MEPMSDRQIAWLGVEPVDDLINGRYNVSGMRNE